MPTHPNPQSRCPLCLCSYRYATAFENHIHTKHADLAELYFGGEGPDSLLEDAGPLPYVEDKENDSDGEKIELLNIEDDEDVCHRKGPLIQTFADAGRPTGDGEHYQEHLQRLIEYLIEPFNDIYDFCLAKWLIDSKISMTKINKFFSAGLYHNDGGSFKSTKTLHAVISDLPTTLGEPSWSFQKTKAVREGRATGEEIAYTYRDPMTCIQYLLWQTVFGGDIVFSPVSEFDAEGEQCYSELHTPNWWWEMQVNQSQSQ
ncbi:hypothetical protein Q9L58_010003 [Maublancomyces gigas]|uniref:C2H2-type domain-containing protein n=1 Tax=Discina gigas TaxID=1032678 RepID=A0ABR3G5D3_9PEZI